MPANSENALIRDIMKAFSDRHTNAGGEFRAGSGRLWEFCYEGKLPKTDVVFSAAKEFENAIYYHTPAKESIAAFGTILSYEGKDTGELERLPGILTGGNPPFEQGLHYYDAPLFLGYIEFPDAVSEEGNSLSAQWKWRIPELLFTDGKTNRMVFRTIVSSEPAWKALPARLEKLLKRVLQAAEQYDAIPDSLYPRESESEMYGEWERRFARVKQSLEEGGIQKAVLSRSVSYTLPSSPSPAALLTKLRKQYPGTAVFGIKENDTFFFGATPETLMRVKHGKVSTEALAGSIARGKDEREDKSLGRKLLESSKDLKEHQYVAEFIETSLREYCYEIQHGNRPALKKLPNIQHLQTPYTALLKKPEDLLRLLIRLFPTPAVCGTPRDEALKVITGAEEESRGKFAGAVGWFNLGWEGDFAVAIRSALIQNDLLRSFAGCGIVTGSNVKREFDETELKLRVISGLFNHASK